MLHYLGFNGNPLGDAGLAALLPALPQLPKLKHLYLPRTNIGDDGVATLVAQPTAGALKSLEALTALYLANNQITDAALSSTCHW